jgi:hypothetical protein
LRACRTGSLSTVRKNWPKSPRLSIPTSHAVFWRVRSAAMARPGFGLALLMFRGKDSRGSANVSSQADLFLACRHTRPAWIKAWAQPRRSPTSNVCGASGSHPQVTPTALWPAPMPGLFFVFAASYGGSLCRRRGSNHVERQSLGPFRNIEAHRKLVEALLIALMGNSLVA